MYKCLIERDQFVFNYLSKNLGEQIIVSFLINHKTYIPLSFLQHNLIPDILLNIDSCYVKNNKLYYANDTEDARQKCIICLIDKFVKIIKPKNLLKTKNSNMRALYSLEEKFDLIFLALKCTYICKRSKYKNSKIIDAKIIVKEIERNKEFWIYIIQFLIQENNLLNYPLKKIPNFILLNYILLRNNISPILSITNNHLTLSTKIKKYVILLYLIPLIDIKYKYKVDIITKILSNNT